MAATLLLITLHEMRTESERGRVRAAPRYPGDLPLVRRLVAAQRRRLAPTRSRWTGSSPWNAAQAQIEHDPWVTAADEPSYVTRLARVPLAAADVSTALAGLLTPGNATVAGTAQGIRVSPKSS